jgi:5'(3')-deoxyribonucleotidase
MERKIAMIDMDGVLADFELGQRMFGNHHKNPGFFAKLKPLPGAIRAVKLLQRNGFDVYFLSRAPYDTPTAWAEKLIWCKTYFPEPEFVNKLILCAHKNLIKGDILIDDDIRNKEGFDGRFIQFGSSDYPNWPVVLRSLFM